MVSYVSLLVFVDIWGDFKSLHPKRRKDMTFNHILVAISANCYKGVVSTVSLVRSPSFFGDGFG